MWFWPIEKSPWNNFQRLSKIEGLDLAKSMGGGGSLLDVNTQCWCKIWQYSEVSVYVEVILVAKKCHHVMLPIDALVIIFLERDYPFLSMCRRVVEASTRLSYKLLPVVKAWRCLWWWDWILLAFPFEEEEQEAGRLEEIPTSRALARGVSGHHLEVYPNPQKSHIKTPKNICDEFKKMLFLKQIIEFFQLSMIPMT